MRFKLDKTRILHVLYKTFKNSWERNRKKFHLCKKKQLFEFISTFKHSLPSNY